VGLGGLILSEQSRLAPALKMLSTKKPPGFEKGRVGQ
jgi:hypothetical protein